jgi:hypothetical protein
MWGLGWPRMRRASTTAGPASPLAPCSLRRRGLPASCALSMNPRPERNGQACARPRFLKIAAGSPRGRTRTISGFPSKGRRPWPAWAPWRRRKRPRGCPQPSHSKGYGLLAGAPDARTRQIRIRNHQRVLHTATGNRWQGNRCGGLAPRRSRWRHFCLLKPRLTMPALVSRFRSSPAFAAHSEANFGIEGTLATL